MSVRIGINPITWSNDDMPALGGDTPLEVCLAETKQAGYAGIEMGGKFPKTTAELRPVLARHGLDFISGWYSAKLLERDAEAEIAAIAGHLDLMAGMGCKVMVFAEGSGATHGDRTQPAGKRRTIADAEWADYGKRVTAVAEHMARRGVRLAFHHHMGTAVQTAEEVDRLMAATGEAAGLLLDTGHATYAGGDPLALARRHAKRIVHVHCKDVRRPVLDQALKKNQSFLDAVVDGVFTVPGDGSIDFKPVLSHLAGQGYAGWLVVEAEQDPAKAHPLTYATMGCRNLSKLAKDAGFAVAA
ncbi:MAG: myo-inosose-2 dehydratase [Alphaproteobacteria bacterium]|nr:myo-inosose-2 dehydratase [Alphaproteobacteria bacterium]